MTPELTAYWIGTAVYGVGLVFALGFGLTYGLSAPWWRSAIGRMFIIVAGAIVVSAATVILQIVLGPGPVDLTWQRLAGRLVGYGLFTIATAALFGTFLHERRKVENGLPVAPELFWVIRRLGPRHRKDTTAMTDPTAAPKVRISTATVPEVWYKAQRVLRTIVQTGIPAFLTFALVLPLIIQALGLPVTSSLYVWLIAFAAAVTAVAGAITRVMAIPAVNAFLVKIGLGTVPASALTGSTNQNPNDGHPQVVPDPKVVE